MAKKVVTNIKLQVPAGAGQSVARRSALLWASTASTSWSFASQFNAKTQGQEGMIIPVVITVLFGPLLHVHHQDAPGGDPSEEGGPDRQGFPRTQPQQGRQGQQGPGRGNCKTENARPQCPRSRSSRGSPSRARPAAWVLKSNEQGLRG